MYEFFTRLLNMSLSASVLILAVVLIRLFLKKTPKRLVCLLWVMVALRLCVPFSIQSNFSVFNLLDTEKGRHGETEYFTYNGHSEKPMVSLAVMDFSENLSDGTAEDAVHRPDVYLPTLVVIWLLGMGVMVLYAAVSYLALKRQVRASVDCGFKVRMSDDIPSPFILGIIMPVIYVPSSLNADTVKYVLAHERAHLTRRDHWWKPLGYLLLTVYWFNPVCWLAYVLLCRDIELACDEKVIKDMDAEGKAFYSQALLSCSFPRRSIAACPVAFGEVGVKDRVKSVLNYKKPTLWVILMSILAITVVCTVFMTESKKKSTNEVMSVDDEKIEHMRHELELRDEVCSTFKAFDEINDAGASVVYSEETGRYRIVLTLDANDVISDERMAEYQEMLKKDFEYVTIRVNGADMPVGDASPKPEEYEDLNTAIYRAIIEHGAHMAPSSRENEHGVASFVELGRYLTDGTVEQVYLFGMAMYMEAEVTEDGIHETSGSHIPVALAFESVDGKYSLAEYWQPGDGSYYEKTIREKFPSDIVNQAMDTQLTATLQTMDCFDQIVKLSGLNTDAVIEKLLEKICSPNISSSTSDYIKGSPIEFRELMFYGQYTIEYMEKYADKLKGLKSEVLAEAVKNIKEIPGFQVKFKQVEELPLSKDVAKLFDSLRQVDTTVERDMVFMRDDADTLEKLEKMLSTATETGLTKCPFYNAVHFRKTDGTECVIYPATDSCTMFCYDGKCYEYNAADSNELWGLLGLKVSMGQLVMK